jgi:nucleoid-associated protein YgaU
MLVVLVVAQACVPTPAGRGSTAPASASASPVAVVITPTPNPGGPTPSPSFIRPTPTPLPSFTTYTVVSGDTLSSIARRFMTSERSIAFWNRTTYPSLDPDSPDYEPDRIKVGWVLQIIPGVEVDEDELPDVSPSPSPTVGP